MLLYSISKLKSPRSLNINIHTTKRKAHMLPLCLKKRKEKGIHIKPAVVAN